MLISNVQIFILSVIVFYSVQAEFNPDVRWTCAQSFVSIFVRTENPFQGVIIPGDADNEECLTRGDGANVAALRLPLVDGRCGVTFDSSEDTFRLSLDVRAHPVLIVDHDKHINITCRSRNTQKKSTNGYFLDVFDGNLTTTHLRYAAKYDLRVSGSRKQNFSVGQCTASGGGNVSVQLTDSRGCSLLPALLSHFTREEGVLTAVLPSMFRFPNSNSVTITCHVNVCDGTCEETDCDKDDSPVAAILDQTTGPVETDDDTPTASVTVTVLEKEPDVPHIQKADVEPAVPTAEPQCARPVDIDYFYALCIILTICSTIGFTINICFCCYIWRRKRNDKKPKSVIKENTADFWIMEQKPVPPPEPHLDHRISTVSYASVKQKPRRAAIPVISEYGVPSRNSDSSSGYGGDIYRRPENNVRHSNSTFMSPSLTMETDLDSSISSNQTSSYH